MHKLALIPLALALAACGSQEPAAPVAATPKPAPAPVDQPAQPTPPQGADALLGAKLDAILAGDWRSSANQARDQLSRERSAKNAALRAAAQLRRQLGQLQNAKQVAEETYVDPESPTAEAKSAAARPKQKQKAKAPPQQD